MLKLIDTHAHIYAKEFESDRTETIKQAQEAGVVKIFLPNVDAHSAEDLLDLEQQYPSYLEAMMGLHPCYVKEDFENQLTVIEDYLNGRKFVAIGEIGTDLYWDTQFKDQQAEAFKIQLQWAKKYNIPVAIHCRNSFRETVKIIKAQNLGIKGIFHCFSGTKEEAKEVIELGFLLGIGGVVTYKNSTLSHWLPEIGLQHLVLETDAPYLAPTPKRGKRNEPAYLQYICEKLSLIYKKDMEEIANTTSSNAELLFNTRNSLT